MPNPDQLQLSVQVDNLSTILGTSLFAGLNVLLVSELETNFASQNSAGLTSSVAQLSSRQFGPETLSTESGITPSSSSG